MRILRQGDVLLREVTKPAGAKWSPRQGYIVAHGEVTGHYHAIEGTPRVWETDNQRFIDLPTSMLLKHQEHACLEVPAATWQIIIEREENPFEKTIQTVVD